MDERASIELHLSSKQKGKNKKGNSFYLSIHEGGKISLVEMRGWENGGREYRGKVELTNAIGSTFLLVKSKSVREDRSIRGTTRERAHRRFLT